MNLRNNQDKSVTAMTASINRAQPSHGKTIQLNTVAASRGNMRLSGSETRTQNRKQRKHPDQALPLSLRQLQIMVDAGKKIDIGHHDNDREQSREKSLYGWRVS